MALNNQVGSFCWWSLMTKDVEKANGFYQQLFDWTLSEMDIPGEENSTIYTAGNGGFGNPVPLENDFPGPSHWITYIAVSDVNETCDRVKKLGGKVCVPAFDIPTVGRTAVITDPVGAAFHIFTPENKEESLNMISNGSGEVCWMELMVDDPATILPFYADLFGWKFSAPMAMNGGEYTTIKVNDNDVGGFLKRPESVPAMPPVWLNYFAVESIDECSSKVSRLQGKVVVPKTENPETGYFALMEDPTGAHAYLFEMLSQ